MNSIKIPHTCLKSSETPWLLPLAGGSIRAGFPSPAHDFSAERLDLMQLLVKHPQATYFWRVAGDSMCDAGIDDGDLITVDRALRPMHNDIVVALVEGECTVKYLHLRSGRARLRAANALYPDLLPRDGQNLEIWGVVTACIKRFARGR